MNLRNQKILRCSDEGGTPVLPFERDNAERRLAAYAEQQAELSKHHGDSIGEATERGFTPSGVEALRDAASVLASMAQVETKVLNGSTVFDWPESCDEVTLGNLAVVEYPDGDVEKILLVGACHEVGHGEGYILASLQSPLGRALLGKRSGDAVCFTVESVEHTVSLLGVEHFQG